MSTNCEVQMTCSYTNDVNIMFFHLRVDNVTIIQRRHSGLFYPSHKIWEIQGSHNTLFRVLVVFRLVWERH